MSSGTNSNYHHYSHTVPWQDSWFVPQCLPLPPLTDKQLLWNQLKCHEHVEIVSLPNLQERNMLDVHSPQENVHVKAGC